jgi:hypothetical protein
MLKLTTMAELFHLKPRRERTADQNLAEFIRRCKEDLSVFGSELDWLSNYWASAGVTFGNLDQRQRVLRDEQVLREPFLEFSKAYLRYQQGHRPTRTKNEMRALRALERALILQTGAAEVVAINGATMDAAAEIARSAYSPGVAYHSGRELERLALFLQSNALITRQLDWTSPIGRPNDRTRTGAKAKALREKKLPSTDAVDAIAEIFASQPEEPRDIFTTCTSALLVSAPSRISEVLALDVDCEVRESKRDGTNAYGWRFFPAKGGEPFIKWIPDSMVCVAEDALSRMRKLSQQPRWLARWFETRPEEFPRHPECPEVGEDVALTRDQVASALGVPTQDSGRCASELCRMGFSSVDGRYTLRDLNAWARERLPKGFPWFDKTRRVKYSQALYCAASRQLDTMRRTSPVVLWKPTSNVFNNSLESRDAGGAKATPSIFDRYGFNSEARSALKVTSHQFRHLLNTIAQRGGLTQEQIARWSGRREIRQNSSYDHMSEFELVDMLKRQDPVFVRGDSLQALLEDLSTKTPMSQDEFEGMLVPTAHVTEYGFCIHDFVMSPCQRFRDCINCVEQVCIKGDHRVSRLKERLTAVDQLIGRAAEAISESSSGGDRWLDIQVRTKERLLGLLEILTDERVPSGSLVRLRSDATRSRVGSAIGAVAVVGARKQLAGTAEEGSWPDI